MKSVATTSTAPSAVIANAQPLRPVKTKTTASTSAAIPSAAGRIGGKTSLSLWSTATTTVQARKPPAATAAATESERAAVFARSHSSPVVRSVRKVAPWKANSSTTATPPSNGVEVEQVPEVPVKSPLELIGTP